MVIALPGGITTSLFASRVKTLAVDDSSWASGRAYGLARESTLIRQVDVAYCAQMPVSDAYFVANRRAFILGLMLLKERPKHRPILSQHFLNPLLPLGVLTMRREPGHPGLSISIP